MADPRTEAIEAMVQAIALRLRSDEVLELAEAREDAAAVLDAIPAEVLARLAIERGGMEQVGWRSRRRWPEGHRYVFAQTRPCGAADPVYAVAGLVHACPPGDAATTPCCGRTPFELPLNDRITADQALVTCRFSEEASRG